MQQATIDTLFMTFFSMVLVIVIGLILGLALYSLGRKQTFGSRFAYTLVSIISNVFRSTPFMILMVLIIPFTTLLVGSFLGAKAAIDFLNHSFYNLLSSDERKAPQIFFAGNSISSTYLADLIEIIGDRDFSVNVISKSGTTTEPAIALAWQEGFQRGNYTVTLVATVIILIIVFILQAIGDFLTKATDKR